MLSELQIKINLSIAGVATFRSMVDRLGPAEMWIIANGVLNAFYSLKNELLEVAKNEHAELRPIIDLWRTQSKVQEMNALALQMREDVAHRGAFSATTNMRWEVDQYHNTELPRLSTNVVIGKGAKAGAFTPEQFLDHAETAFDWWNDQMVEIVALYENQGGKRSDLLSDVLFGAESLL